MIIPLLLLGLCFIDTTLLLLGLQCVVIPLLLLGLWFIVTTLLVGLAVHGHTFIIVGLVVY